MYTVSLPLSLSPTPPLSYTPHGNLTTLTSPAGEPNSGRPQHHVQESFMQSLVLKHVTYFKVQSDSSSVSPQELFRNANSQAPSQPLIRTCILKDSLWYSNLHKSLKSTVVRVLGPWLSTDFPSICFMTSGSREFSEVKPLGL